MIANVEFRLVPHFGVRVMTADERAVLAKQVESISDTIAQFPTHTGPCHPSDRCAACLGRQWIQQMRDDMARADHVRAVEAMYRWRLTPRP